MIIVIVLYLAIGAYLFKPKSLSCIHWNGVDLSSGFFMIAIPLWVWLLIVLFWLPIAVLYYIREALY